MEKQDRIDQLVAENQELLALTKQAFVKREVEKESVSVDEEWEKFAAEHAEELEALEKDEPHAVGGDLQSPTREVRISNPFHLGILPYKVAASRHPHCASFRWRRCKVPDPGGTNSKFVPTVPSIVGRYCQDGHDSQREAHCFRQCRIG